VARGWESKSVEEQMDAARQQSPQPRPRLTAEEIAAFRQKNGLLLSRKRIAQELRASRNPQHRRMLELALADLDSEIKKLG
jgi:hypothetical protein